MEVFTIDHLSFAYPEQEKNAISDLSLSVRPGEFLVPVSYTHLTLPTIA